MTRPTDEAIQALLDKEDIRQLVFTYSRAIDRHDPELLRSIYFPDAIDDHGRFCGSVDDFANYAMGRMEEEFDRTSHLMSSINIELDGDVANGETYMIGIHIHKANAEHGQLLDVLACRLVDRFERREGEWRIANRVVVRDWRHTTPLLDDPSMDDFKLGTNGADDLSYLLGMSRYGVRVG